MPRPIPDETLKIVSFNIAAWHHEKLKDMAKRDDRSVSEMIRERLDRWLADSNASKLSKTR